MNPSWLLLFALVFVGNSPTILASDDVSTDDKESNHGRESIPSIAYPPLHDYAKNVRAQPGAFVVSSELTQSLQWDPTDANGDVFHRFVLHQYRPSRRSRWSRRAMRFEMRQKEQRKPLAGMIRPTPIGESTTIPLAFVKDRDLWVVRDDCTDDRRLGQCFPRKKWAQALQGQEPPEEASAPFTIFGYEVHVLAAVDESYQRPHFFRRKRRVHTYALWIRIPEHMPTGKYGLHYDLVRKTLFSGDTAVIQSGSVDVDVVLPPTIAPEDTQEAVVVPPSSKPVAGIAIAKPTVPTLVAALHRNKMEQAAEKRNKPRKVNSFYSSGGASMASLGSQEHSVGQSIRPRGIPGRRASFTGNFLQNRRTSVDLENHLSGPTVLPSQEQTLQLQAQNEDPYMSSPSTPKSQIMVNRFDLRPSHAKGSDRLREL